MWCLSLRIFSLSFIMLLLDLSFPHWCLFVTSIHYLLDLNTWCMYSQQEILYNMRMQTNYIDGGHCYTLNWGRKDRKCAPGLITWSGSDGWTRQGRLSASRELWLQPTKVVPLAPTCSQILGHQDTKSLRDSERMNLRGEEIRQEGG